MVGVRELVARESLLLADDMGLGKTVQAIAALRILIWQHQLESALIVVPAGIITQWRLELHAWAPELRISTVRGTSDERSWQWRTPAHVYLTSHETLRSDFSEHPSSPVGRTWDLVVLDEAQKIKNADTDVSRVCKRLRRRRQWALTGTPLENKLDDLVSILQFIAPADEELGRARSAAQLTDTLRRLQLRRRKREVLQDLPPKIVSNVMLPLTPAQRASYDRAEQEGIVQLKEKGENITIQNVLELILRLKQICNFCPATGESSKLDDVRERLIVLAEEGYKALVFTQFTSKESGAAAIARGLQAPTLVYSGELSAFERDRVLERFKTQPDQRVLILSLRAGGQGLNLQEASYVFHFDRWWNPAVEGQAEARAHRMGQMNPVNVYTYTCENTIEERIERILKDKQLLFDEVVDGITADVSTTLSADELFGLFGLKAPQAKTRRPTGGAPPRVYSQMTGVEFEAYVQRLIQVRGWQVRTTPLTRDGGIDLIAKRRDDLGVEVTLYVQCKNHLSPVGVEKIRELNGAMRQHPGSLGVVVCPSGFTADAKAFAEERSIALWDRHTLFELENSGDDRGSTN